MKIYISKSRNIYNQEELQFYLENWSKQFPKENVKVWIFSNLRNWFLNKYEKVKPVEELKKGDPSWVLEGIKEKNLYSLDLNSRSFQIFNQDLEHALGYLSTLEGRLNHSVGAAIRLGEKYIEELNRKASSREGLIRILYTFEDGYTWVSLLDGQACKREGKLMQHCSGDETQGYFNKIASKEIELWSLRDRYNNPHCTVEYDTNWHIIHQIKGKNNKGILNKYVRYLQEFITYMKNITQITFEGNTLAALGIFVQNNRWCSIEDIPENYVVDGDLNLGGSNIEYLPIGLHVKGNCYLSGTRLKEIGKGLCVDGDATFAYTCIKCIPSGVIIKGNLHLANSAVEHLSLDLVVGGTLDLRGTHIRNNPKDCKNVHRIIPYFNK